MEEMCQALRKHKEIMKSYPRNGTGLEAFVDSSDTGYTKNAKPAEKTKGTNGTKQNPAAKSLINDDVEDGLRSGGLGQNGNVDGVTGNAENATNAASGPEGVDGMQYGTTNGVNGHANGTTNGAH